MKMIDAGEFQRNVRTILTELNETGESLTITPAGCPLAELRGMKAAVADGLPSLIGALAHPAYRFDNPFDPVIPAEDWDAYRGEWEPRDRS